MPPAFMAFIVFIDFMGAMAAEKHELTRFAAAGLELDYTYKHVKAWAMSSAMSEQYFTYACSKVHLVKGHTAKEMTRGQLALTARPSYLQYNIKAQ